MQNLIFKALLMLMSLPFQKAGAGGRETSYKLGENDEQVCGYLICSTP